MYFYKNQKNTLIVKINIIKDINGVKWYNDITSYKNKPIIFLLVKLNERKIKLGVESTHILETNLDDYSIVLEILTLNLNNSTPQLMPNDDFKKILFNEFMSFTN